MARFLAEYEGFDFDRGVLALSAHPFTTNLHNHDVRITTHYQKRIDSSIFSVLLRRDMLSMNLASGMT